MAVLERLLAHRAQLSGDFVPAEEAERFVAFMETHHPDEIVEYMHAKFVNMITIELGRTRRSERARAHRSSTRAKFAKTLAEGGTDAVADVFAAHYVVDSNNTERALRDMNGPDHLFVAHGYERSGRKDLLRCQFHKAVARRVGQRRTGDVFTDTDYLALHDEIVNT